MASIPTLSSCLGISPTKEMNVNTSIWDKLTHVAALLSVITALVWVGVLYFPLMHQNEVMRQQIVRLDKQIQQEEVANRRLRLEIDSLKTGEGDAVEEGLEVWPGRTRPWFASDFPASDPPATRLAKRLFFLNPSC